MNILTKEDVLHVAHLSRLHIDDQDIEKYRVELEEIMNSINYIESIKIDEDIMVSPSKNVDVFSENKDISDQNVFLNVKDRIGDFIKVEVEND